jgi:hypothetical protein
VHLFILALPRIFVVRRLLAWGRQTGAMPIKCSICLDTDGTSAESMCQTRCGHTYHRICLVRWISRYGYGTYVIMNGVKFYRKQLFHCIGFLVISSFFFLRVISNS